MSTGLLLYICYVKMDIGGGRKIDVGGGLLIESRKAKSTFIPHHMRNRHEGLSALIDVIYTSTRKRLEFITN